MSTSFTFPSNMEASNRPLLATAGVSAPSTNSTPLKRLSSIPTTASTASKQRAADLRARIAAGADSSASNGIPRSRSPINGLPAGYKLARGASFYGTMTAPHPDLYTIPEVAEPADANAEKLDDAEAQNASVLHSEALDDTKEGDWSPILLLLVFCLCMFWLWAVLLATSGRLDILVHLMWTPVRMVSSVYTFIMTPHIDNACAPITILKGNGARRRSRKHSGGGDDSAKRSAAISFVPPPFWYTVAVAGTVYLADMVWDALM